MDGVSGVMSPVDGVSGVMSLVQGFPKCGGSGGAQDEKFNSGLV